VRGGKGRAGEVRWGMGELMVLLVWEGRGRRGKLHGGPSSAALMEGGEVQGAREAVQAALL
jgi:hypothetical protein